MRRSFLILMLAILLLLSLTNSILAKGKELAIIYCNRFDNYVEQYKMYKSLLGFDVTLKDVDDFSPKDTAHVWQWIHNTWYPGNNHYVFLLGNVSEIPSNRVKFYNSPYPIHTDWYYASHDHSTSAKKHTANLIIGRFQGESNANKALIKLLYYEFNPQSYNPKSATNMAAYKRDNDPNWRFYARNDYKALYDFNWGPIDSMFFDNSPFSSWTNPDSIEVHWAKNFLVLYWGHGNIHYFAYLNNANPDLDWSVSDLPLITIENNQFFIITGCFQACIGTYYQQQLQTKWNLIDQLLCQTNYNYEGPIGGFGKYDSDAAVVNNYYYEGQWYNRTFAAITDSSFNTWGQIFRGMVRDRFGTDSLVSAHTSYVGDPTLSKRTSDPTTSEAAPNSYLSVSANSVTAYSGQYLNYLTRVSAYAPNTGWFDSQTIIANETATFNTSNRPLYVAFTRDNASVKPTIWMTGGTLTKDTWMIGKIRINGDLTVSSGKTMEIFPGAELLFKANTDDRSGGYDSNKAELIIEGTLKADSATFKSTTASDNSWYGIVFDEATSSSYLKKCTIQRARRGVRAQDCSPTIESCDLDHNQYGLWAIGGSSSPTFKKNDIAQGSFSIAVQSSADPDILDNKLSGLTCIYIHNGGDPTVKNNDCNGHPSGNQQVYSTGSATGGTFGGTSNTGNYYSDDVSTSVIALDGGDFSFNYGIFEGPGSSYYINNCTGNSVDAENCYWDDGGLPSSSYFNGTVDYDPALASGNEPDAGTTWKISVSPFANGLGLVKERKFAQAIPELVNALRNNIGRPDARRALSKLSLAIRKTHSEKDYLKFFKDVVEKSPDQSIKQKARSFFLYYYAGIGQLSTAEQYALAAPKNSLFDRELLLDMVYYYALAQDEDSESRIVGLLKERYPNDENLDRAIKMAKLTVEDDLAYLRYKGKQVKANEYRFDEKDETLIFACPNPFNATTAIAFDLPKSAHVKFAIYDITGRLVQSLVDKYMDAGQHRIVWNGKDNAGRIVASGLYFGQLVVNDKRQTIKMVLTK